MKPSQPKRVIIVGSRGQDGRILTQALEDDGSVVAGLSRDSVIATGQPDRAPVPVTNTSAVGALVNEFKPDEIYYLAAYHDSSETAGKESPTELMTASYAVHVIGYQNFLDAAVRYAPAARVFYAASSHVFGWPETWPQDESTPFNPQCVYGITKAAGVFVGRYYRRRFGLRASAGILYNHESLFRPVGFASRRIAETVARIAAGVEERLVVGDIDAVVDWGYAPDYIAAMRLIAAEDIADDYVIATGEPHTVGDFAAAAFDAAGIDRWRDRIVEDSTLLTGKPRKLLGDPSKLKRATGWEPRVAFRDMVRGLVEHHLNLLKVRPT